MSSQSTLCKVRSND